MSLLGFTLGATLGSYTQAFSFYVSGTARTTGLDLDEFTIVYNLGQPTTLTARVVGFTPAAGNEVRVYDGGTGGPVFFGGHITHRQIETGQRIAGDRKVWTIRCQDYSWLMDRYARVTAVYESLSYNTIVHRILASFTNGGFSGGYIPSSLGTIDRIQFTQETVWSALNRIADAAGGYLSVTPDKHVHIFTSPDHLPANAVSLTNSSNNFADLMRELDYTDIATRVEFEGGGSATTAVVSAAATTIPVEETRWYSASGGSVMANQQEIAYTGVSTRSGPGSLTGCTGITYDIPQGEAINVFVRVNDTTAQTALATALGGGLSGIAVHYQADKRLTLPEATGRANKILTNRKNGSDEIRYDTYDDIHTASKFTVPGKLASVSVTAPETISGTYRVQQVVFRPRTIFQGTTIGARRSVTLGTELRDQAVLQSLTGSSRPQVER